jgi:hypothetical protein
VLIVVLGAVALLVAGGVILALASGDDGNKANYDTLKPGDCIETPGKELSKVTVVRCDKPHGAEVFASVDDPAPKSAKYPGKDLLVREAAVGCGPQFQPYVGVPFDQSHLKDLDIVPAKESWDSGSRRLVCTLATADGKPFTGTLRDSKK